MTRFLTSDGKTLPVVISRRKGTRHFRLRLNLENNLFVTAPVRASDRAVGQFIESNREWVEEQMKSVPPLWTLKDWLKQYPRLSGCGEWFTVEVRKVNNRKSQYTFGRQGKVLELLTSESESECDSELIRLVKEFAKDVMTCRVAYFAKMHNLNWDRVSIRNQSSRWGSCSQKRSLSFNWRMVLLEPKLHDYVILHELAHLTEMNHGPQFWALLENYDPERVVHEQQLDEISSKVMRVGRKSKR